MRLHQAHWERLAAWRGAAALLVAFGHMVQIFVYPDSTGLAPYSGLLAQASVMMFFVVSGCSIAASGYRLVGQPDPLRRYLSNRLARILPPLLFAVLLAWVLFMLAPYCFPSGTTEFLAAPRLARPGFLFDWSSALGALLFLNGFGPATPPAIGPLWSLSFEVWLYVIFFLLLLGLKQRRAVLAVAGILLFVAMAWRDQSGEWLFAKYSLVWAAGVWVFLQLAADADPRQPARQGLARGAMWPLGFVTLYFAWRFVARDMNDDITLFNLSVGLSFAALLVAVPKLPSLFARAMVPVSRFGYTLYLVHFPVYLFVYGVFQPVLRGRPWIAATFGLASMGLCVLLAYVAARVLERKERYARLIDTATRVAPLPRTGREGQP